MTTQKRSTDVHLERIKQGGLPDVMDATCGAYLPAGLRSSPHLPKVTCQPCVRKLFDAALSRLLTLAAESTL